MKMRIFLIGNNLLDSEKEKREHQAVSNFIFNQLSAMGLQPKKSILTTVKIIKYSTFMDTNLCRNKRGNKSLRNC